MLPKCHNNKVGRFYPTRSAAFSVLNAGVLWVNVVWKLTLLGCFVGVAQIAQAESSLSYGQFPEGTNLLYSESQIITVYDESGHAARIEEYTVDTVGAGSDTRGKLIRFGSELEPEFVGLISDGTDTTQLKTVESISGTGLHLVTEMEQSTTADTGSCVSPLSQLPLDRQGEVEQLIESALAQSVPPDSLSAALASELELIVVAPGEFTNGRTDGEVLVEVLAAVEGANLFYEPLGLKIKLVGVQLIRPGPEDPYRFAAERQSAIEMLEQVRFQWFSRTEPKHDAVVVFGRSPFSRVFGLAFTGSGCLVPDLSYMFVTIGGRTGALGQAALAATLAHEVGHLLGMNHDNTITVVGPTVMWPFISVAPAGFSLNSIKEFEDHLEAGGGKCLGDVVDTSSKDVVSFADGTLLHAQIQEGQTLEFKLQLQGDTGSVFYQAVALPPGAVFNPSTGVLRYTPGFDTVTQGAASKTFLSNITAFGFAIVQADLEITVFDANRPPKITFSTDEYQIVEAGSEIVIGVSAADLDPQEQLSLRLSNASQVRRYPRRPLFSATNNSGALRWNVPRTTRGIFVFSFEAVDARGAVVQRSLVLNVIRPNRPPVITIPSVLSDNGSGVLNVPFVAFDPEQRSLTLDVQGLPPGAIIRKVRNSWTLEYIASTPKEEHKITFSASDGMHTTRKSVTLSLNGLSQQDIDLWPGTAGARTARSDYDGDGHDDVVQYDFQSGMWRQISCDGEVLERTQFGGLLGDVPIPFISNGAAREALYRVSQGQGYWIVKREKETEVIPWGLPGDIPVPGDYDGDGETDLVVYRPGLEQWFLNFSSIPAQFLNDTGLGSDSFRMRYFFAGDVDGDGLDDRIIVSRKYDGSLAAHVWFALGEQAIFGLDQVGLKEGGRALVGDLDSDGRVDFLWQHSDGSISALTSRGAKLYRLNGASNEGQLTLADCSSGGNPALISLENQMIRMLALENQTFDAGTAFDEPLAKTSVTLAEANMRVVSRFLRTSESDLNGNRQSSIAVFRPDASQKLGRFYERESYLSGVFFPWLPEGYGFPTSGDFLDEGVSRLTLFGNGVWYVQGLSKTEKHLFWGIPGDHPVAGDYNGDGVDDLAVYRSTDSSWWLLFSNPAGYASTQVLHWGEQGDQAVPADYDGDGRLDFAVWRPATGVWYILYANGNTEAISFGSAGDVPLPADYLGEGRSQVAFWRPETGTWFIKRGNSEVISRQWGLPGDIPLSGDFNGDGRTELVVWRPSTAFWYARELKEANEWILMAQFGLPGDVPLGAPREELLP